jgi:hypothetical protein
MKLAVAAVVLIGLGGACATSSTGTPNAPAGVSYGGGDGLSCESRVLILGATGENQGVAAEYAWLRKHYPGSKVNRQSMVECETHPTDQMSITTADGRYVDVHFDISDFFGKGFGT